MDKYNLMLHMVCYMEHAFSKNIWQVIGQTVCNDLLQPIRSTEGEIYYQQSLFVNLVLTEASQKKSENIFSNEKSLQSSFCTSLNTVY